MRYLVSHPQTQNATPVVKKPASTSKKPAGVKKPSATKKTSPPAKKASTAKANAAAKKHRDDAVDKIITEALKSLPEGTPKLCSVRI